MGVNELNSVNNQTKPGCCAHGLPAGACPVCSMSGGGLRKPDRNGRPGEMSYHQCAMIGNMMKARALAQKNHEANLKQHALNLIAFESTMERLIQNVKIFSQIISQNFAAKPTVLLVKITILPVLVLAKNTVHLVKTINNIRFEITDKLNAIYGEAKAFLQKKLEQAIKVLKSPLELFGKIFKKNNADDDDTKIDDDKKIFNLKKMIHKIKERLKKGKEKQ